MAQWHWFRRRRWGLAIGGLATSIGCVVYSLGWLTPVDRYQLDFHFQRCGAIEADPRILLVDIDDHSLFAVHWPWQRRTYADLVSVMRELGASVIVLDFVLSDPSSPRVHHAAWRKDYEFDSSAAEQGDRNKDEIIFDDDELAEAMRIAGNVYLGMYATMAPRGVTLSATLDRAIAYVGEHEGADLGSFRAAMGSCNPWSVKELFDVARLTWELEKNFSLDPMALVDVTGVQAVEARLADAKRLAARRLASRFLETQPEGGWVDFFERTLPSASIDTLSADRAALVDAFRIVRGRTALAYTRSPAPAGSSELLPTAFDSIPPLEKFIDAAKGVGLVAFDRQGSGGVVRELPMLVYEDGMLVPHLGFLVACDVIGIKQTELEIGEGSLVVGSGERQRALTLTPRGTSLVNWHSPAGGLGRTAFSHLPAAVLLEIINNRRSIEENHTRYGLAIAELVARRHRDTHSEYQVYVQAVNARLDHQRSLRNDLPPQTRAGIENELESLKHATEVIEQDSVAWLDRAWSLWRDTVPNGAEETAEREEIEQLHKRYGGGRLLVEFDRVNAALSKRSDDLMGQIGPVVSGKICLVGYTASAASELIATPVDDSMPGVMAHANVINTLLQNRPIASAPQWINLVLILFVGAITTITTNIRGPWFGLAALGVLCVCLLAGAATAFSTMSIHFNSAAATLSIVVVWASVTLYRQLTEERTRRRLQRALSQYTSAPVAARIVSRISAEQLAPVRWEVTCVFCDVAGFTRLSEAVGATRTREILNPYLRTASEAIVSRGGVVNKFMGDGIFSFFNAPIHPCHHHAEAACGSALEILTAVRRSRIKEADDAPLRIRIGLSTGEASVGDFGSEAKLDYTCIGDTVNVGQRLEEANKALGTNILVVERTRRQASCEYIFRSVGLLRVSGRSKPVAAHELIGASNETDQTSKDYVAQFEEGIRHFQACQWGSSRAAFERCRKLRSEDPALEFYISWVSHFEQTPPGEQWDGAVSLVATPGAMLDSLT